SWRAMNRSCPISRGRGAGSRGRNSSPISNHSGGPNRERRPSWEERRQPARRARGDRSRPVDNYRSRPPIEKRHLPTPHFSLGKAQTEKCRTEKFRAPGLSPQQQVKRMNAVNTEGEAYEDYLNADYGWKSWLGATDHKRIGLLYLVSITLFF